MAFYDDMADVATELLTEFGRTVTFERITDTFNPVTGKDTARTTTEFTPVGVEVPINKALIDGTRVQVGDRFLTIDAATGYVPEMSDRLQDSPFTGYALAMEPGARYSVGLPSDAEVSGQTVSKTAPADVTSFTTYSGRSVSRYDTTTWDGHHRGVEFRVDSIATSQPGSGLVELIVNEGGSGGDALRIRYSQVTQRWTVYVNGNPYGTTYAGAIGTHIGMSIHAQSGDVTVWFASGNVNKQSFAALGGLFHGITTLAFDIRGISVAGGGGTTAGDSFSATLVTDYTDFQRDYSAQPHMRDIDGTLITEPALSESLAIVNIEPISPAGTPVAYRVQVRK